VKKNMLDLIEKSPAEPAPEFAGVDTEGRRISLSAYKGKSNVVLVLNRGFG
jgi:peroxiredoxin